MKALFASVIALGLLASVVPASAHHHRHCTTWGWHPHHVHYCRHWGW